MKKKVTIQDVANKAGVSKSTVSHVMNNTAKISKETRTIVEKAIKELKYRPNRVASSLRTAKSDSVGLIVPDLSNEYYANVIKGVSDIALKENYSIMISNTEYNEVSEKKAINNFLENNIDGIIFIGGNPDRQKLTSIRENNIPVVVIDVTIEDLDVSSIVSDDINSMKKCVNYLVEKGHKKIGFVAEFLNLSNVENRYLGYRLGLEINKISFDENWLFIEESLKTEKLINSYLYMKKILKDHNIEDLPTAFICTSDLVALGFIRAIKEAGFTIAKDFSIIGYDDISISDFSEPRLSTIRQNKYEIGKKAMELIKEKIENPSKKSEKITFPTKLIIRESA
ncbi:LacI family DNA-binding transcriptional regulator [Miniphocaeibacter halophilus]|uniref:LacI family DNA-binding transcriptional regulator n=1 Tax=Miniphocaeibacter halophilus TaxID=2931922 RepID=A0AC61MTG4_9FIRM|nr:LacI family DNA-binding transcriptional regulator [Miniphocaeibacter halophilus]QQK09009.1 LacI family DNA-binding transcriptional regulator [Miniphocaeibacter halophilus]